MNNNNGSEKETLYLISEVNKKKQPEAFDEDPIQNPTEKLTNLKNRELAFDEILSKTLHDEGLYGVYFERLRYKRELARWNEFQATKSGKNGSDDKKSKEILLDRISAYSTDSTIQFRELKGLDGFDLKILYKALSFLKNENVRVKNKKPDLTERNKFADVSIKDNLQTNDYHISPETLLENLEIDSPDEIDMEAIAFSQGALVVYDNLQKCEAFIVSVDNTDAVIVVNKNSLQPRQRFSIAHELGHWMQDQGQSAICKKNSYLENWSDYGKETLANQFAKDLLMPERMFRSQASGKNFDLQAVRSLAQIFSTSLTATALRLAELGTSPAILMYFQFPRYKNSGSAERKWYVSNVENISKLYIRDNLQIDSHAYQIRIDDEIHELSGYVSPEVWFRVFPPKGIQIEEHSIRINCNSILTLLTWDPTASD